MYADQNYFLYCCATQCNCELGKYHNAISGKWKLELCKFCGSVGIHKNCKKNNKIGFGCDTCLMSMTSLQSNSECLSFNNILDNQAIIGNNNIENLNDDNINSVDDANINDANHKCSDDTENMDIITISSSSSSSNKEKEKKYIILDEIEILTVSISGGPELLIESGWNNCEKNKYKSARIARYMSEVLDGPAYDPRNDKTSYGCWCEHCAVLDIYDEETS